MVFVIFGDSSVWASSVKPVGPFREQGNINHDSGNDRASSRVNPPMIFQLSAVVIRMSNYSDRGNGLVGLVLVTIIMATVAIIIRTGIYRICEYDTELLRLMVRPSLIDFGTHR